MKFKSIILIAAFLLSACTLSFGQDAEAATEEAPKEEKAWTMGGMGGLTFNQAGLFNWTGGGTSNITLISNLGLFANYKKGNLTWDNSLDLGYGIIWNNLFSKFDSARTLSKAEDKIELNSKFGKKAWSDKVFYSAYLNYLTQFAPGFSSPFDADTAYISKFMAPGYLKLGLGLDWKPVDGLSMAFSPIAGKFTFVLDERLAAAEAFGVNRFRQTEPSRFIIGTSKNVRSELGASVRISYKKDIMKNIGLDTKVDVFFNYLQMPKETYYERIPGDTVNVGIHADVDWQTSIVAKVNKYINVTLFTHLLYDGDVVQNLVRPNGEAITEDVAGVAVPTRGIRVQFKEIFGVGFSYKF